MGRFQAGADAGGRLDPLSAVVRAGVGVASRPIAAGMEGSSDLYRRLMEGDRIVRENEALKMRLSALELYEDQILLLEDSVQNLRGLADLKPLPGRARISADVVSFAPYEGRITLSVGSERGILPQMPVINADGLVAVVQTVWKGGCQATLITNVGQKVGGLDVSRRPPTGGIIKGRDAASLQMEFFDPNASVRSGDTIVTSGHGDRIPRMLRIGKVYSVEDDPDFGVRRAKIVPFMNTATLKEVQILK